MDDQRKVIAIISILVFIILGLGGYIVYDKFFTKKEEETKLTQINNNSINLNAFYQIEDTLNKLDLAFNDPDSPYFAYPYLPKKVEASKFDMGAALYLCMRSRMQQINQLQYTPEEIVKADFQRIFGNNLEYSIAEIKKSDNFKTEYSAGMQSYAYFAPIDVNMYSPEYIAINSKTKLEDDKVVITRKIVYVEYEMAPGTALASTINLYTDNTKKKSLGKMYLKNGTINKKELLAKHGSKLQTFNYTFKEKTEEDYSLFLIKKEN